jgi:hypothetical protein
MNPTLIAIAAQILLVIVTLFRESGEDSRFAGEKLMFRS